MNNLKFTILIIILAFAFYVVRSTLYANPTLAVTAPCPTQSPNPRVTGGLISTKSITGKFSNPGGNCVVDSERASFTSTEVPNYDTLKSLYFDKSTLGTIRKYTLTGNQTQSSATSPINLTDITPVAQWNFDAGSGTSVADSKGTYPGSFPAAANHWFQGKFGNAGFFNGAASVYDYVSTYPINTGQMPNGYMAITAWVYPMASNVSGGIVDMWDPASPKGILLRLWGGKVNLVVGNGTTSTNISSTTTLLPYTWYHVAVTMNAAASVARIYVNAVNETSATSGVAYSNYAGANRYIGWSQVNNDATHRFKGLIDNVRIYDNPLSQAQVNYEMVSGNPDIGAVTRLKAEWLFNESSGTVVSETSKANVCGGVACTGTFNGSSNRWATGHASYAGLFNGVDGIVTMNSELRVNPYTITGWIFPFGDTIDGSADIVGINTRATRFKYNNGGALCLLQLDSLSVWYSVCTNAGVLKNNQWQYVAVTYDGTSVAKLYVNGSYANPAVVPSVLPPGSWSGSGIGTAIGDLPGMGATHRRFKGLIDQVKVFSRALSATEISADYNNTTLPTEKLYLITGSLTINTPGDITVDSTGIIFVQGNLNINTNLTNNKNTAGLVFIVKGNVNIATSVTQVNAVIISSGTIYTAGSVCKTSSVLASQLIINGSLIALQQPPQSNPTATYIYLCRTLGAADATTPAEKIIQQPKFLVILKDAFSETMQKWSEIP